MQRSVNASAIFTRSLACAGGSPRSRAVDRAAGVVHDGRRAPQLPCARRRGASKSSLLSTNERSLIFLLLARLQWISISPVYIMLWLGVAYSLGAAALWPTLSCIVEERLLGTAYGCMTAVQNLALAIFPLVIGCAPAPAVPSCLRCLLITLCVTHVQAAAERAGHQGHAQAVHDPDSHLHRLRRCLHLPHARPHRTRQTLQPGLLPAKSGLLGGPDPDLALLANSRRAS